METTSAPSGRRPNISLWTLRVLLTLNVLAVACQPLLAGLFLVGDVDAIEIHGLIGSLLAAYGMVVIVGAVAYVLGGRGPVWTLPVTVGLFFAYGLQAGMGYARTLQVHVPLGVAIVVGSVFLAIWVWSPVAGRPRRTPARKPHGAPAAHASERDPAPHGPGGSPGARASEGDPAPHGSGGSPGAPESQGDPAPRGSGGASATPGSEGVPAEGEPR